MAPRLKLRDIAFFERPTRFARPFRFGAITVNATPQLFVRVEIEVEGRGTFVGASAEMLVPKWFDKRPELSPEQTVDELRRSLSIARELYLDLAQSGFETAFGLHAACLGAQVGACAGEDIPPLAAAYGPAEIDKAILDALLRGVETSFFDGMAGNIAGIDARLSPDLKETDITTFLAGRKPLPRGIGRGPSFPSDGNIPIFVGARFDQLLSSFVEFLEQLAPLELQLLRLHFKRTPVRPRQSFGNRPHRTLQLLAAVEIALENAHAQRT